MRALVTTACFLGVALTLAPSSVSASPRQGEDFGHGDYEPRAAPCMTAAEAASMWAQVVTSRRGLATAGLLPPVSAGPFSPISPVPRIRLEWPVLAVGTAAGDFGVHGISNFVDTDRTSGNLLDYDCGARTYDQHNGTDIFSWPFPWNRMAADEVQVVAAAPGVLLFKADGFDDQNCAGGGGAANRVSIQHLDGSVTLYLHLKKESLTSKSVGSWVNTGEFLGVMGSSGNSTGVHLHFTVFDGQGNLVDPYHGPCNTLGTEPTWRMQAPYFDSAVNRMQVGSAKVVGSPCPGLATPNDSTTLSRGALAYFTTFYRDQRSTTPSTYRIRRPDGTLFKTWTHAPGAVHFAASWWWWSWFIGAGEPTGRWRFEVGFEGATYTIPFHVI